MKIYARQDPTTDEVLKEYSPKAKRFDTVFYKDKKATKFYCRWPWHYSNRPVSRKRVTLNCYNWQIVWI